MGQRFQARQPEKAAGPLDGVDQEKNVIENLGVVRILLEPHQLIIDRIQALVGLRQELPQKIIHQNKPSRHECWGRPSSVLEIQRECVFAISNPSGFTTALILVSVQIRMMMRARLTRAGWRLAKDATDVDQ